MKPFRFNDPANDGINTICDVNPNFPSVSKKYLSYSLSFSNFHFADTGVIWQRHASPIFCFVFRSPTHESLSGPGGSNHPPYDTFQYKILESIEISQFWISMMKGQSNLGTQLFIKHGHIDQMTNPSSKVIDILVTDDPEGTYVVFWRVGPNLVQVL